MPRREPYRIAYVTGTRAEFGLMRRVLDRIRRDPRLALQLVVTGQHLDRSRGHTIDTIRRAGLRVDATVTWPTTDALPARPTGRAIDGLARAFTRLGPDLVMVTGDRVEAFAAATASHLNQIRVAHVHGGEIAQGQADDSLRHAITKLSHVHFVASDEAAKRVRRLGERADAIHVVGAPGLEGISHDAAPISALRKLDLIDRTLGTALVLLHPTDSDATTEKERTLQLLEAVLRAHRGWVVALYPNSDPGADGIVRGLEMMLASDRLMVLRNLERGLFLGLLREAILLVGNSSAGIIEAGCFGTPVVDVGPRQTGRTRGANVIHAEFDGSLDKALREVIEHGPYRKQSPYARPGTSARMARILTSAATHALPMHKTFCD
jgi:GDP/UDP-N,N'-diacetylbacillosamine 2-epimerase (hydrolysing)